MATICFVFQCVSGGGVATLICLARQIKPGMLWLANRLVWVKRGTPAGLGK